MSGSKHSHRTDRSDRTDRTATTSLSSRSRRLQLTQTMIIHGAGEHHRIRTASLDRLIAAGLPAKPEFDLDVAAALVNERTAGDPRYAVRSCIGSGSNGIVFAAWDRQLEREVAIKISRSDDPQEVDVFLREAQVIAGLEHPGIVPVHDLGRGADGRGWYSMRRLRGESLQTLILRTMDGIERGEVPQIGLNERIIHLLRTCEALAFAHAHQVIHQDLKPGNIMIDVYGDVTVVDWGSALTPSSAHLVGNLRGTPAYMAPEQARGSEHITAATDVYALGGTLFELLFWRLPLEEPDDDIFWSMKQRGGIQEPSAEELDGVPAPLYAIAAKAMAPDPADRYPDAGAMRADLVRFQAGLAVSAYAEDPLRAVWRLIGRYRVPIGASLVALVAIGISVLLWQRSEMRNQRSVALGVAIDRSLQRTDLLSAQVQAQVQQQLQDLARLDADAFIAARRRAHARVAQAAQVLLAQPDFDQAEERRVQRALEVLQDEPQLQETIATALQQRRRSWNQLLRYQEPFTRPPVDWEDAWAVDGRQLLVGMRSTSLEPDLSGVPTPVSAAGALQVELRVPEQDLTPGQRLGVAFELLTGGSYALYLEADPDAPDRLVATCTRSASVLDRTVGLSGPVRELTAIRSGSALRLILNNETVLSYDDVLPLSQGVCRIVVLGGQEHALAGFALSRREPPGRLVELERADRLLRLGLLDQATALYREQLHAVDPAITGEAGYKLGLCLRRLDRPGEAREIWQGVLQGQAERWALLAGCELWVEHLADRRFEAARRVAESLSFGTGDRGLLELPYELRQRLLRQMRSLTSGLDLIRPEPQRVAFLQATDQALQVLDAMPNERVWVTFALARALHWEGRYQEAIPLLQNLLEQSDGSWSGHTHYLLSFELLWMRRMAEADEDLQEDLLHPQAVQLVQAQQLAAAGDLAAARDLAGRMLAAVPETDIEYKHWAMAQLLVNLRTDDTHSGRALAAATPLAYRKRIGSRDDPHRGLDLIYTLATESAANQLQTETVGELMQAMQGMGERLGESGLGAAVLRLVQPNPESLHRTWTGTRGQAVLHELAICRQDMSSLVVTSQTLLLYGRIADGLTPQQAPPVCRDGIWAACHRVFDTYVRGGLSIEDMLAYSLRFLGNPLGPDWTRLQGRFSQEMQIGLGYLLTLRTAAAGDVDQARVILRALPEPAPEEALAPAVAWLAGELAVDPPGLRW